MSDLFDLQQRVAALERRLDALDGGVVPPVQESSVDYEIRELLRSGNKINAVKRYRELTGAGLKEALDAVERIEGLGLT